MKIADDMELRGRVCNMLYFLGFLNQNTPLIICCFELSQKCFGIANLIWNSKKDATSSEGFRFRFLC